MVSVKQDQESRVQDRVKVAYAKLQKRCTIIVLLLCAPTLIHQLCSKEEGTDRENVEPQKRMLKHADAENKAFRHVFSRQFKHAIRAKPSQWTYHSTHAMAYPLHKALHEHHIMLCGPRPCSFPSHTDEYGV